MLRASEGRCAGPVGRGQRDSRRRLRGRDDVATTCHDDPPFNARPKPRAFRTPGKALDGASARRRRVSGFQRIGGRKSKTVGFGLSNIYSQDQRCPEPHTTDTRQVLRRGGWRAVDRGRLVLVDGRRQRGIQRRQARGERAKQVGEANDHSPQHVQQFTFPLDRRATKRSGEVQSSLERRVDDAAAFQAPPLEILDRASVRHDRRRHRHWRRGT